MNIRPTHKH